MGGFQEQRIEFITAVIPTPFRILEVEQEFVNGMRWVRRNRATGATRPARLRCERKFKAQKTRRNDLYSGGNFLFAHMARAVPQPDHRGGQVVFVTQLAQAGGVQGEKFSGGRFQSQPARG